MISSMPTALVQLTSATVCLGPLSVCMLSHAPGDSSIYELLVRRLMDADLPFTGLGVVVNVPRPRFWAD